MPTFESGRRPRDVTKPRLERLGVVDRERPVYPLHLRRIFPALDERWAQGSFPTELAMALYSLAKLQQPFPFARYAVPARLEALSADELTKTLWAHAEARRAQLPSGRDAACNCY